MSGGAVSALDGASTSFSLGKDIEFTLDGDSAVNALRKQEEKKLSIREQYQQYHEALRGKEYTAEQAHTDLLKDLNERHAKVDGFVNTAMEKQMLSLIETRKFSVRALKDSVFQEVKVELAGFAAKAAVKAIYFTAVGFAKLAQMNFPAAGAAFKSAAGFALVSGASIAAASVLHKNISGSNEGGTGGYAAKSLKSAVPVKSANQGSAQQIQQVTIVINNPLSTQNWDQIAEDNIIPAINAARDRNIEVVVMES